MRIPRLKKKLTKKKCHNIEWVDNYAWIHQENILDVLKDSKTPFMLLGHVTKGRIAVDDKNFGKIDEYKTIYNNSLAKKLNK